LAAIGLIEMNPNEQTLMKRQMLDFPILGSKLRFSAYEQTAVGTCSGKCNSCDSCEKKVALRC
jgi:hypothetical protein